MGIKPLRDQATAAGSAAIVLRSNTIIRPKNISGEHRMYRLLNTVFCVVAIASVTAEHAAAQARHDTNRGSCAAAQAIVTKAGAIVLGTGPSLFDRYVTSRAYCTSGDLTEPAFVPTADNHQCWVGYTCRQRYG